jgi:hypothetical protein
MMEMRLLLAVDDLGREEWSSLSADEKGLMFHRPGSLEMTPNGDVIFIDHVTEQLKRLSQDGKGLFSISTGLAAAARSRQEVLEWMGWARRPRLVL